MNISEQQVQKVHIKTMYVGLVMNVFIPAGVFVAALLLESNIDKPAGFLALDGQGTLQMLFYILLAVSAFDIGMTWYIRRNYVRAMTKDAAEMTPEGFEARVMKMAIIVFALNVSYTIYGFILYLMGGSKEILLLFVALTLIGYQLFRPRDGLLKKIIGGEQLPPQ